MPSPSKHSADNSMTNSAYCPHLQQEFDTPAGTYFSCPEKVPWPSASVLTVRSELWLGESEPAYMLAAMPPLVLMPLLVVMLPTPLLLLIRSAERIEESGEAMSSISRIE